MKFKIFVFIFLLILSLACGLTAPVEMAETNLSLPATTQSPLTSGKLPKENTPDGSSGTAYSVTNPTSGAALYVAVYYPETWDGQMKIPALVFVPGGSGDSSGFVRSGPAGNSTVSVINNAGFVAIIFDPDGRGNSSGTEDYDGFIQQDGLAEIIRNAATWPGIDSGQIGLVTFSFGITMGAGVLARYPDLSIKFLMDWEGPADRNDTGGCDSAELGHLKEVATCDEETFWIEREAANFIGEIQVPYLRIQSEQDHVQPDHFHTVLMINNAVNGSAPWVRLNDEIPNKIYDINTMPSLLPENRDGQKDQLIVKYAFELFER